MHLRESKDGTDFWAGQDITEWDLVIKKDEIAAFFMM